MLEIKELTVKYGNIRALDSVDLEVHGDEVVAIMGANGAGKTTMLRTISGLLHPSGGNISFLQKDITHLKPREIIRRGIIHIPEGRRIFPELTVVDNLRVGGYSLNLSLKQLWQKTQETLALFPELQGRERQPGGQLSGGEQQMLAIARGLMSNPRLMLLDEPTMGLAPIILERIATIMESLKEKEVSILLGEQNMFFSLEIADRAYVIETGQVVLQGDPESLENNPKVRSAYLGIS